METEKNRGLVFADLHLHSKYSRAVSQSMDPPGLARAAVQKGLSIIATGDFTHPKYFVELKTRLEPSEHDGFFKLKGAQSAEGTVDFILSCEVCTICSAGTGFTGIKKVHHIVLFPDFDCALQFNEAVSKKGNLAADGRPTFGGTTPAEIAEIVFQVSDDAVLIPAHIWTPWFSALGSKSGYDSIEEAYGDQARKIFAIESGLSSDPAMIRRVGRLDRYATVSNSDSHSPYPWRLGRECNAFSIPPERLTYDAIFDAIKTKDPKKFAFTVEVDPNYGKYHFDGHRACGVCLSPAESKKARGTCPVCRRPLTIGVQSRVEELADRPEGFVPRGAVPFWKILPLAELISAVRHSPLQSRKVAEESAKILMVAKSELDALLGLPAEGLLKATDEKIARAVMQNREGKLTFRPGYDGEYGQVTNFEEAGGKKTEIPRASAGQKSLWEYF